MIVRRAAPVRRQEAPAATARAARSGLPAAQQFRQLGEVDRHAAGVVFCEPLCSAARRPGDPLPIRGPLMTATKRGKVTSAGC